MASWSVDSGKARRQIPTSRWNPNYVSGSLVTQLTPDEQGLLDGKRGPAARLAMEMVVAVAEAVGAERLIEISGAHIDGCLFHGQAGLDFANALVDGGGQVVVPTSLNVSSLDLLHPDLYRGDQSTETKARELMEAYVAMGCQPTWTCAPYQVIATPEPGAQLAWAESNAIVYANSVIGARTERYGDFLDICCALTGRAPFFGLHTDEGRKAEIELRVEVDDHLLDDDLFYPLLGHHLGLVAGTRVAAITGLDERATPDRLKAIGAAAASSGAVAMFHVVGVTPEAPSLDHASGAGPVRTQVVHRFDIEAALRQLTRPDGELAAVSIGTPHASLGELSALSDLVAGRHSTIPFYVNTSRDVLASVPEDSVRIIEDFGATFVVDTCTYITPIIEVEGGTVMTNSGKWAYYAPANLGLGAVMGSLRDCVDSAVAGEFVSGGLR